MPKVPVTCQECGKEFAVFESKINDGRKYCSRECSAQARSKIVGEKNPMFGKHPSPETRAKISAATRGKPHSPEHTAKVAAANRGRRNSPETIANMSAAKMGDKNPMFGTHLSKEARKQISAREKGKRRSPETIVKMSEARKGKHLSAEHRAKISAAMKTPEVREKISEAVAGEKHRLFGKHHSPETRARISAKHLGKFPNEEVRAKISAGRKACMTPELRAKMSEMMKARITPEHRAMLSEIRKARMTPERRAKMSEVMKGLLAGEKNPRWLGGISFEPYCPKFTKEFKERVRAWYNYQCSNCKQPQTIEKHCVHHVYYNKMACCEQNENGEYIYNIDGEQVTVIGNPNKFVALCKSCHTKTNKNRVQWAKYFEEIINNWYDGRSWLD